MPYDNLIARGDTEGRLPDRVAAEVIEQVPEQSAAMTLFRRVPMSDRQERLPVLDALPMAYWVDGDTGLKQSTNQAWDSKVLRAEELAVIVPIPEAVLADANFDVWGEVRPRLAEAIGRALDAAIFFDVNKPATFPGAIVPTAVAAGNAYERGTATAAEGGVVEDLNQTIALVEDDGHDVNGFVMDRRWRRYLRGARGTDGQPLTDASLATLYGEPISYAMRGQWPTGLSAAEVIAGDWSQGILGVRQDITYKVFDQGVLQDNTGAITLNLMQQDSVALRVVARFGFQVANPLTWEEPVEADRYPFAVLRSPAA